MAGFSMTEKIILEVVRERLRTNQYLNIGESDGNFDFSATKAMKRWEINGFMVFVAKGDRLSSRIVMIGRDADGNCYKEIIGGVDKYRRI